MTDGPPRRQVELRLQDARQQKEAMLISRRQTNWLILGGSILAAAPFTLVAAEFWDRKDPAEWSAGDIEKLLKRSPWAEQVTVNGSGVVDAPPPGGRGGGMPGGL